MNSEAALRDYFKTVEQKLRGGIATEHTYRADLEHLLNTLGEGARATNEPKRIACGAPDYVLTRDTPYGPLTIGYVEAKDIGVSLDDVDKSDQLRRYKKSLENLILTDYLDFRWYVNGEPRASATLATNDHGRLTLAKDGGQSVIALLQQFLTRSPEPIRSPRDLAVRMARLTHMIRDIVVEAFRTDAASQDIKGLFETFQKVLIPDLTEEQFADMFAQTLAYGLFAARVRHPESTHFSRVDAAALIPRTNPLLRRLFASITGPYLDDEPHAGFVEDLAEMLAHADMEAILADFGKRTRQEDPIVHFYETFLASYDPNLRDSRGVYYTPEPVVSYIVRSVDALLKSQFGCSGGLADEATIVHQRQSLDGQPEMVRMPKVLILDPACGTGTFLYAIVDRIREQFMMQGNAGMWSGYVRQHLLPRLFGFELLMAPYAMAHLKLGMQLGAMDLPESQRNDWAYDFAGGERLGVFLTNTLEEAAKKVERLPLGEYISEEANEAASIKRDDPVMVVLGNPPYSGISANSGDWIKALLHGVDTLSGSRTGNYFEVDGQPLGERKVWLNDDYVKFIRFAQRRIERTGHGILAFITNHGYLDNPTFRGMRQSLIQSFDEIFLLNLHGNAKKSEIAPESGKDQNVFDIQQGVAIGIFIRLQRELGAKREASVHYADLWGERDQKYAWLSEYSVEDTSWTKLAPKGPSYRFVPQNSFLADEYIRGWKVGDVFLQNNAGVVTARDSLVVGFDDSSVLGRMGEFRDTRLSDADLRAKYFEQGSTVKYAAGDTRGWKLPEARLHLRADPSWQERVERCLYRPFDMRSMYYTSWMVDWPRTGTMRNMIGHGLGNMALVWSRPMSPTFEFSVLASSHLIDQCAVGNKSAGAGISYLGPLYVYPDIHQPTLIAEDPPSTAPGGRRPNLAPEFIADFAARLGLQWVADGKGDRTRTFGPEDVFSYIYAVLHSPTYRERYAEMLKEDFPRLPLTTDADLFRALCASGDRLVALHLMEQHADPKPSFPIRGDNTVAKVAYTQPGEGGAEHGRVWINNTQYVDGVPPEVWHFHVGGYQVAEKWLKDRKGRTLTYNDLEHYANTIAALAETLTLMSDIDATIEDHGGWPLTGSATS